MSDGDPSVGSVASYRSGGTGDTAEHEDVSVVPVAPPWVVMPEVHPLDIGWRWGTGEDHLDRWHAYVKRLDAGTLRRLLTGQPAPRPWARHALTLLGQLPADTHPDAVRAWTRRAVAEGLVADDIGYPTWLRGRMVQGRPPWAPATSGVAGAGLDWCPAELIRYACRSVTYWVWFARENPAAIDRSARTATSWGPWCDAMRTGEVPSGWEPTSAWDWLSMTLCACGQPAPPWRTGLADGQLRVDDHADDDDYPSYEDAWWTWFMEVVDDPLMWNRYTTVHATDGASWDGLEYVDRQW